jgi:hypothetical protein
VSGQGICPDVLIECGWLKSARIDTCSWELTAGDVDFEPDIQRDASRMESEASDRLSAGNRPVSCKKGRISGKNRSGITRIYAIQTN